MIRKFLKDSNTTTYRNGIELAWLFLISELLEFFIMFGAFDPNTREYNYRRIFWIIILTFSSFIFLTLIGATCVAYLLHLFGVI